MALTVKQLKKTKNNWNKIVDPRDDELAQLVMMVQDLISRNVNVIVNVNNHYEGAAPLTIEKIRGYLK